MSTVTQICAALETTLSAIAAIDKTSILEYLPPIETESAALIITPFNQEDRFFFGGSRSMLIQGHTIVCEIWCKHSGDTAATFTLARDVATAAVHILANNQTLDGTVQNVGFDSPESSFRIVSNTSDNFVKIGGVSYLPIQLKVPVLDFVSI